MKFISSASGNSRYRGYDYYEDNRIKDIKKVNENEYEGVAIGSNDNLYNVRIDLSHPKKNSHCTCPHAEDNKIMCKHKVALYFSVFPDEADKYIEKVEEAERLAEEYEENLYTSMFSIVMKLKKDDLQVALISILENSPEWVLKQFVSEYSE